MARWISKPKQRVKVRAVGRSLEGRLSKIEQELAQVEANERLNDCICDDKLVVVTAGMAEEFRAEMNRLCPVHGFREMDIRHVTVCRTKGSPPPTPAEIRAEADVEEVLSEYNRRLEESKRQRDEDD